MLTNPSPLKSVLGLYPAWLTLFPYAARTAVRSLQFTTPSPLTSPGVPVTTSGTIATCERTLSALMLLITSV